MHSNLKIIAYSLLSLILGVTCIYLIIYFTPITIKDIYLKFKQINLIYIILIFTTTFINNYLLAYKWKQVIQRLSKKQTKPQIFYLFYIVLGALVGIVIPRQLSMLTVQSLATNLHKVSNLSNGFLSAIYNQILNLVIPLLLLPPTILFALKYIPLSVTIFLSVAIVCIAPYIIRKWQKPIIIFILKIYYKLKKNPKGDKPDLSTEVSVLKPSFTIHLYWITVLFHALGIFRNYLVVIAAGLNIKLSIVVLGTPLIYLAMLLSITPGNLGIMEWTWIGILEFYNVSPQDAASFAILQRILLTLSIIFIFISVSLTLAVNKFYITKNSHRYVKPNK